MKKITLLALASATLFTATSAQAGGFFGSGGLIRGSVGNFLDQTIDRTMTPIVRETVVRSGEAAGSYYGGPIGGVLGRAVGQGINEAFSGGQERRLRFGQVPSLGRYCQTDIGLDMLDRPAEIGLECVTQTAAGDYSGQVVS